MKPLVQQWYSARAPLWLLPLSWLFLVLVKVRRLAYKTGLLRSFRLPVPVIIVGNISVGGTGKTPLVAWLVKALQQAGYRPGIISRGYGGQAQQWPQQVLPDSDPLLVGDEPLLLAQRCGCPVVAAPDRVLAARQLLEHSNCNILISDDGLQHYRLQRDIEIVVVDGARRFGNGHCLPAGPLREPVSRLKQVDFVVANGAAMSGEVAMQLVPGALVALLDGDETASLAELHGQQVHAVAGIGNPARFFALLKQHGLSVIEHPFPDHHHFVVDDLFFADKLPVLMTEKDAVKCRRYADARMWYLPVEAQLDDSFARAFMQQTKSLTGKGI
ncbi:MAG: tetraacyldisaccharide 4'-kinase [Pseudomonadota bacterium]|nr:tetraacyldisaccharide 4'-kinase [Pseudomonadota bacterium]